MYSVLKKILCVLVATSLFALTGCSGGDVTSQTGSSFASGSSAAAGQEVAMGRYIEEKCPFPAKNSADGVVVRPDGVLEVIGTQQEFAFGPWELYQSTDSGKSWEKKEAPWLETINAIEGRTGIISTTYDADGNLYFVTVTSTPEYEAIVEQVEETGVMPTPDQIPPYVLRKVAPDGTIAEVPVEWRREEDGAVNLRDIVVAEDGSLIASHFRYSVQYDLTTGKEKAAFPETSGSDFLAWDNTYAAVTEEGIKPFDLSNGGALDVIPLDGAQGTSSLSIDTDGKALIRCDGGGIFRWVLGGSVWERVVDGSLTSLGLPSVRVQGVTPLDDGSFLVLSSAGDAYNLVRFFYSAGTPTVPGDEITVYALRDSQTIRQAAILMQVQNPDLLVKFQPALDESSSITVSDAIRALGTELLAGKGPDVLVLDGLPIRSYIEKGVLADISAISSDGLCPDIADTYRRDGKLFAIPARFAVPQMWGPADMAGKVTDLSALADWAEEFHRQNPEQAPFFFQMPEELIKEFYYTCAPAWRNEDGSIQEAEFGEFLTGIKRLTDAGNRREFNAEQKEYWEQTGRESFMYGLLSSWASTGPDEFPLLTYLSRTFDDLDFPDAVAKKTGGRAFALMPGQAQNVYVPEVVLGVNANSPRSDRAVQFVEQALSDTVQAQDFGDGYPVRRSALEAGAAYPYAEGDDGRWVQTFNDGQEQWIQVFWPEESFMKERVEQFSALSTPSEMDAVLLGMIIDETRDFFSGGKPLEDTVKAVVSRTQAYLAE